MRLVICFLFGLISIYTFSQTINKQPELTFLNPIWTIDTLIQGDSAVATFYLKNTSNRPLHIKKVLSSCSCSLPDFSKKAISPGDSTTISVTLNTSTVVGPFNKQITVLHTGKRGGGHLFIRGFVKAVGKGVR